MADLTEHICNKIERHQQSSSLNEADQIHKEKVDDVDESKPKSQNDAIEKEAPSALENPKNETDYNETQTTNNPQDISDTKQEINNEMSDQINTEKEAITKCIDGMVKSLNKLERDSQQTAHTINQTFDALIKSINNRKSTLLNELNNDVLTQKTNALKQMESLKKHQQTVNDMDSNVTDVDIKLILDTKELNSIISNFGCIRMGKPGDLDYDPEAVSPIIDSNIDLLLAEIPIKKLFRWALKDDEYHWECRVQRTIILFYQSKKSYKVRMVIRQNESETDSFLMNQWVSRKELMKKESLVWLWSAYDATIAKKGYTKWCAKFFDDVAFERFEDQYNQAKKINIQVLNNEEQIKKNKLKQETKKEYYDNDEKLCFEMNVWRMYLWGNDASGKGCWISYANKSKLQFFENRNNKKIRIILRENESKELKLNHWIPTDVTLKSRGENIWEWQVYDELTTEFNKKSTLKLSTICATFIDKADTIKFKQLFEKYQKINQKAEDI